eukprot:m.13010 g.13010  ORF g.13010 m.13010 type:complete len:272 (+) comp9556_c0_seq1:56-871(+)
MGDTVSPNKLGSTMQGKEQHQFWDQLNESEQKRIKKIADAAYSALVEDKRYRLTVYRSVMVANEFVEWAVKNGHAATQEHAILLGVQMTNANIIHHVTDDHAFSNAYLFFRYRTDDKCGPAVRTLQNDAVIQGWANVSIRRKTPKRMYIVLAKGDLSAFYTFPSESSSCPHTVVKLSDNDIHVSEASGSDDRVGFCLGGGGWKDVLVLLEERARQQSWIGALLEGGATMADDGGDVGQSVYEFTALDIDNKPRSMSDYKGKVVLIVNVASN